jgi:hypothetical protein
MSFSSKHNPPKKTLRLKPPPYDFTGERERIATHEARFADALDNNGHQATCPYCYQTARVLVLNGKRGLYCGCKA